jgi:predicted O-linked N-acetylglucosamine transferase (SPINDLY family)
MDTYELSLKRAQECGDRGNYLEATSILNELIKAFGERSPAYLLLGKIAEQQGPIRRAIELYQNAVHHGAAEPWIYERVGTCQLQLEMYAECEASFLHALRLGYRSPGLHSNLAAAYLSLSRLTEAEKHCRDSIALDPNCFSYTNLGRIFCERGEHAKAVDAYREALRLNPGYETAYTNLLLTLCYTSQDPRGDLREHQAWAAAFEGPLSAEVASHHDLSLDRVLKIGYVSADFREHSVAYFIEPVLHAHNVKLFDVYLYSDVQREDETTRRIKSYPVVWRPVASLSDQALAETVRADSIDILVDLSGHTAGNRLLTFARRPAPVQVTWIGYPNTTGMKAIDYRISDPIADPPESPVSCTEEIVRIDGCFICYGPPPAIPPVSPPPFLKNGFITFGSFNNCAKITGATIALWTGVLQAITGSRLVLKSRQFSDAETRGRILSLFAHSGVAGDRVKLYPTTAGIQDHLAHYGLIDIALDTFPYNGTTTTCEALFMGVPVISRTGPVHASRVGASLLAAAGLGGLACDSNEKFIGAAKHLCSDMQRLAGLRAGLRPALLSSPLCDNKAFAQKLENAFAGMWRRYVGKRKKDG